jgi:hypothetical protein
MARKMVAQAGGDSTMAVDLGMMPLSIPKRVEKLDGELHELTKRVKWVNDKAIVNLLEHIGVNKQLELHESAIKELSKRIDNITEEKG